MKIIKTIKNIYQHLIQSMFKRKKDDKKVKPPRKFGKAVIFCRKCKSGVWTRDFGMKLCPDCKKRESRKGRNRKRKNTKQDRIMDQVFRATVRNRDGNRCVECDKDFELTVHHVKHKSTHQHLRHNFDNGVTLCRDCHAKKHKKVLNESR